MNSDSILFNSLWIRNRINESGFDPIRLLILLNELNESNQISV